MTTVLPRVGQTLEQRNLGPILTQPSAGMNILLKILQEEKLQKALRRQAHPIRVTQSTHESAPQLGDLHTHLEEHQLGDLPLPTEINPLRRSAYSPGSPRARSSRKRYPVYPRECTSARRPAYSPGGTTSRRLAYTPEIYGIHRPAYSPGGTPARRESPLRRPTCSRGGGSIKRRPVYSSENIPPRLL